MTHMKIYVMLLIVKGTSVAGQHHLAYHKIKGVISCQMYWSAVQVATPTAHKDYLVRYSSNAQQVETTSGHVEVCGTRIYVDLEGAFLHQRTNPLLHEHNILDISQTALPVSPFRFKVEG